MFKVNVCFFIITMMINLFFPLSAQSNERVTVYEDADLKYQLVSRKFITENDLKSLEPTDGGGSIYLKALFQDYEPKKGALIIRLEQFYKPSVLKTAKDLGFSVTVICLTLNDCFDKASANTEAFKESPIKRDVFDAENQDFVKSKYFGMKKYDVEPQFTYKFIDKPTKLSISLMGSLSRGESKGYGFLLTSYYVQEKPSAVYKFFDSKNYLYFFKFFAILGVLSIFGFMFYKEYKFAARPVVGVGVFLLFLGLINALIWNVNYMVVGTSFIAFTGVLIIFGNTFGKLVYLLGAFLIASMVGYKFGFSSKNFISNMTFLLIMGFIVNFLNYE